MTVWGASRVVAVVRIVGQTSLLLGAGGSRTDDTRRDGDTDRETTITYVGYLIDVHSWHLPGHVAEDGTELDVNPGDLTVASMRRREDGHETQGRRFHSRRDFEGCFTDLVGS